MWVQILVRGWFFVSMFGFEGGQYNVLLQNCPTMKPCRIDSYKISDHWDKEPVIGEWVWVNEYIECETNLREQENDTDTKYLTQEDSFRKLKICKRGKND